jgi:hypothetical protein
MTSTTLISQEASSEERVSDFLSAASALISGIALLLAVAVAF